MTDRHTKNIGKLTYEFNRIHSDLNRVGSIVAEMDDSNTTQLFEELEKRTLAGLRRLRLHLDVPMD